MFDEDRVLSIPRPIGFLLQFSSRNWVIDLPRAAVSVYSFPCSLTRLHNFGECAEVMDAVEKSTPKLIGLPLIVRSVILNVKRSPAFSRQASDLVNRFRQWLTDFLLDLLTDSVRD